MVVAEVPKLAFAAEYFFKMGWKERDFDPRKYLSETVDLLSAQVLLLMATALNVHIPGPPDDAVVDALSAELRLRQQRIAEITEMIHVASLLHDDVLDDADTRRDIVSYIGWGFLAFKSLRGPRLFEEHRSILVVSLLATVVKHLVTGETIQMTTASEQRCSKEYHLQKTYYKTASLISNSCKAIALLAGQTAEVSTLAYEYGKNLGLAFQLIDDVLDFTGTSTSLGKGSLSDIHHIEYVEGYIEKHGCGTELYKKMASKSVVKTGGSVISRLLNNPMLQKHKCTSSSNHLIASSCFEIAPMIYPASLSKFQTSLRFPQTDDDTLKRISADGFLYPCGLPSLRFFLPDGDGSSSGEPMLLFPKRTYQPSTLRRKRVHGFLVRLLTQIVDASLLMIVFGTHLSITECGFVTLAISIPIA
ncbi:hypothetical protein RHMOL_Rhmol07G0279400 [Rhododendron molle]|nr:hypothetical protein RHMOL_Rhmol07G0279400 [Rhododendron molle]